VAFLYSPIAHEFLHITIYEEDEKQGLTDKDGDGIGDVNKATYLGVATDSDDPDTYNVDTIFPGVGYDKIGDNELRCRMIEANHTIPVFPEKDWSDEGDQY